MDRGRQLVSSLDLVRRTVETERGAAYLSTSHRNMERAGMRVQSVRALWTPA